MSQSSAEPRNALGDAHHIQIRYQLSKATFATLFEICERPGREMVLRTACASHEFLAFPMKADERPFFHYINDHTQIPYPDKKIDQKKDCFHKVFLLVQVDLLGISWPNRLSNKTRGELYKQRGRIYNILDRVLRCIIDILGHRRDGRGVSVGLDVLRSVKAGVWEGSDQELLQVEGIGPASMNKLTNAGIRNIRQLSNMNFYHIERLLSRNPPFGQSILRQLAGLPLLRVKVDIMEQRGVDSPSDAKRKDGNYAVWVIKILLGYDNKVSKWNKRVPDAALVIEGADGRLLWFWNGSIERLEGGKEMFISIEARLDEELMVTFACVEVVGTKIQEKFRL